MAPDETGKTIAVAFVANLAIAAAKFGGFLVTGSSAVLAESVHSLADTLNELLLMVGKRQAHRKPDALHQFGYGRSRYFYSFVVALMLFTMGSIFALREGYDKIRHPQALTSPLVAIVILVVAALLEGYSLRNARKGSARLKGSSTWWEFVRNSRIPEPLVVLLEDSAALIGLALAFAGVTATAVTRNPLWDGLSTVGIGVLLGGIAVILIVETHSLLIGEGATGKQCTTIRAVLEDAEHVDSVADLRTQYLAPDELLVAAKVVFRPQTALATAADVIRDTEARAREAVPAVRAIYIQPESD